MSVVRNVAEATGYLAPGGGGLRVELLDDIKQQAIEAREAKRAASGFGRPAEAAAS